LLQQQGLPRHVVSRDLLRNVLRICRKYRHHGLRTQRRDFQLLVLDREIYQRKVDLVLQNAFDALWCRRVGDDQLHAGIIETQTAQERRQSIRHGRQRRADAHVTDPSIAKAAHGGIRAFALMKNAPGHRHKRLARHRSVRLLAETLDQLHAEAPFELANLQADCRLRQVEMARGRREAAALDYFEQGAQLIQIEAAHPK
jgi:hypothetical protein